MTTTAQHVPSPLDRPIGHGPVARLYRGQTHYDFINRWRYWFALSGTVIAIGLVALGVRGLNFSIDFRGGTVWEVPSTASVGTVRADLGKISSLLDQSTITTLTSRQTGKVNIDVQASSAITSNAKLVGAVSNELAKIAHVPIDQVSINSIGPSWGSDISNKAIEAVVVFLILISGCIAVYFESKMAIAALVALLHDMMVTVGIYAVSGFQVSPDTVIAFLTVMGYSLYDTIVVFDKVKENTVGLASTNRVTYTDVVNLSMNQVLARSINTSFVAIMPVFCILVIGSWILGASALNDFGLALFIGLMSGAYSSIFIASPILALLKEREPRYTEIRKRLAAYPQSRQILTPASVAGGIMYGTSRVAPSSSAGRSYGSIGAMGAGAGLARAGAATRTTAVRGPSGGLGNGAPDDGGGPNARGPNAGSPNGEEAGAGGPDELNVEKAAAGAGAVGAEGPYPNASVPGEIVVRGTPSGARRVPPRPRKKPPRRR